jgi:hypothetical protein
VLILSLITDLLLGDWWLDWVSCRRRLKAAQIQSAERIRAAIADVRKQADERRKVDERHMLDIIKHWRDRALVAEGMCKELGHTIVPGQIEFTDGNHG